MSVTPVFRWSRSIRSRCTMGYCTAWAGTPANSRTISAMVYRPNSAGATSRASTATASRFAASMTGLPIMVHRSPLLIAARRSLGDVPPSTHSPLAAISVVDSDGVGEGVPELDTTGCPPTSIVVLGGRISRRRRQHDFAEREARAWSRVLSVATTSWGRDDDGCRRRHGGGG